MVMTKGHAVQLPDEPTFRCADHQVMVERTVTKTQLAIVATVIMGLLGATTVWGYVVSNRLADYQVTVERRLGSGVEERRTISEKIDHLADQINCQSVELGKISTELRLHRERQENQ